MYELSQRITRKHILLAVLGLIILILLIVFFRGSFLFISYPQDKSAVAYYKNSHQEDWQTFPLSPQSWKLIYLPTDEYDIQITQGNKELRYQRQITPFSFTAITLDDFPSPKKATSLGFSAGDCAYDSGSLVAFYFCDKNTNNQRYVSTTSNGTTFSDSQQVQAATAYQKGIIKLTGESGKTLFAYQPLIAGDGSKEALVDTYFDRLSSQQVITDTTNDQNSRLALLKDNKVMLFSDIRSDYKTINLKKYISTKDQEDYTTTLYVEGNKLFVYYGITFERGTDFGELGELSHKPTGKQVLLEFDFDNQKLLRTTELPSDLYVEKFRFSKSGEDLVFGVQNNEEGIFKVNSSSIKKIIPVSDVTDFCATNEGIYYANSDSPDSLYLYQFKENRAYLVYKNPSDALAGVSCLFGKVYISSSSNAIEDTDYRWLVLENSPETHTNRPESIFPLFDDDMEIAISYPFRNTIMVRLHKAQPCEVSSQEREKVIHYISNQGVDLVGYNFIVTRDC